MTEISDPRTAKVEQFLSELTELSDKYGIAIAGEPVLFMMEKQDYAFSYRADDDSKLSLG